MTPDELGRLAAKYRRMGELRRALPTAAEKKPLDRQTRADLRQFAAAWPGALRELDTLATDEIDRRAGTLEDAAQGRAPVEDWMRWMSGYHALLREALAIRRGERPPDADVTFVTAVLAPAHGRIMVAVFDRLAQLYGADRRTIWNTLFPANKGVREYR